MNYAFGGKFVYYVYHVYYLRKRYEMLLNYMAMILVNDEHENVGLGLKIEVGMKPMCCAGKKASYTL